MSAYTRVQSNLKDKETLLAVLRDMGYRPYVYDVPQKLEDYHGRMRKDTAEIVIPRRQLGSASNDIGFRKTADGTYEAIISQFDSSCTFKPEKLEELKLQYNDKQSMKIASSYGLKVTGRREQTVNGKRSIQYQFAPGAGQ